jgi:DNA-binding transcriptional LysR family regulator
MSIRQLRTLIAIADHGSFGAAAEVTHVTQSAVSMQVRALEDELRVEIFDRSRRPPVLNAYGRRLVERAREVVRLYDQMVGAASDAQDLSGSLTLGAVPTTFIGLVPKALAAVRSAYPNLHINVVTELSALLVELLQRGEVDAAVLTEPRHELDGLTWNTVATEPLAVIAPADARDLSAREILTSYPYIRFSRRAWVGRTIETALRENGIEVQVSMELDTLEAISIMVYHGLGASIVPVPCVEHPSPLPLSTIPFGGPAHRRTLVFAERLSHPRTHLTGVMYAELARLGRRGGEEPWRGPPT